MKKEIIAKELQFKAIRSGGPGGQHANKVSSKVELHFDILSSAGLLSKEKELLLLKLKSRLSADGILKVQCDESRSQHKNKELVSRRFYHILKKALHVPKKRKATKPSKSSIEQRLKSKKIQSEKKAGRRKSDFD